MWNIIIGAAIFILIGSVVIYLFKNRKNPCAHCPNKKHGDCKHNDGCH